MPSAEHQRRGPWPDHLIRARRSTELRLNLRNLYILPSRFGWLWLLTCTVLYLMGTSGASASALLLAYGGLGLFLLAPYLTQFNLQGLELTCGEPQPGFAEETLLYPLLMRSAVERQQLRLRFQGQGMAWSGAIPGGTSRIGVPWIPLQRGPQQPGRLRLESRAPLGLFVCWSVWEPETQQLIYPARRPGPVAVITATALNGSDQVAAQPPQPGTDEWRDLQPHRPEEGTGRLAWKQLARNGVRLSKRFSDPSRSPSLLTAAPGVPFDAGLEHLCDRCCRLADADASFGVAIGSVLVPPGRGRHQLQQCLEALARASAP